MGRGNATYKDDGETTSIFIFNHVITRFGVLQAIVTENGSHFWNFMMTDLTTKLGLHHESSSPYYLQVNGQVEVVNKVLTTMIKHIIGIHKWYWHLILFPTLWAYCTTTKNSTGFTPFHPVYGVEVILPIECEILSLKLAIELLPATSAEE